MRTTAAILLFIASTLAYQITSPSASSGWTVSGPNVLTWKRNDCNPLTFTAVLTNRNRTIMPPKNQILAALVDGTLGSMIMDPPSGGWPTGSGFRVNLVRDAESLHVIFAQSGPFSIESAASSGTSSTVPVSTASNTPSGSSGTAPTNSAVSGMPPFRQLFLSSPLSPALIGEGLVTPGREVDPSRVLCHQKCQAQRHSAELTS